MKYQSAGVDIPLAEQLIKDISGFSDQIGKYAATYELPPWERSDLVAAADGVGTKVILAKKAKELYLNNILETFENPKKMRNYIFLYKMNTNIIFACIMSFLIKYKSFVS